MTGHGWRRWLLARWALGLAAFAAVGVGFARGLVPPESAVRRPARVVSPA